MNLPEWLATRHAEVADAEPLSIQSNMAALSQRSAHCTATAAPTAPTATGRGPGPTRRLVEGEA